MPSPGPVRLDRIEEVSGQCRVGVATQGGRRLLLRLEGHVEVRDTHDVRTGAAASSARAPASAGGGDAAAACGEEGSSKYVGPYAMLRDFLGECREGLPRPLDAGRHQQLLGAVEDLSLRGSCSRRVNMGQAFFRGCDRDFASVLPGFGILFEEDPFCAQCGNVFMPDARFCQKCGTARPRGDSELDSSMAAASFAMGSSQAGMFRRRTLDALDDSGPPSGIRNRGASHGSSSPPRSRGGGASKDDSDLATLRSIEFDRRSRGDIDLDVALLSVAFKTPFGLLDRYNIDEMVLRCWMDASARQYNTNPYHDWRHAVDTVQFAYMALTEGEVCKYFTYHDILALFLACVGHDVGHMGTNNAFLVKTAHPLAMTYNDISPLENMHAHRVFQTFRLPGMNVLESMQSDSATTLRSKIIEAILATDMSHHFELVEKLSARVSRSSDQPLVTEFEADIKKREASRVDRRMLMQCCVHVFDLGHTCRPWSVHKHIVVALEREFFKQGDRERELGLPIMPLMDRARDSAACSQGFFLEKMVQPLLEPFCFLVRPAVADTLLSNLRVNRESWAGLVQRHGQVTAGAMVPEEDEDEDDDSDDEARGRGDGGRELAGQRKGGDDDEAAGPRRGAPRSRGAWA